MNKHPINHQFPWPTHIQGTGLTIIEDIISSIENSHNPKCTGQDGIKALEIAIAIRESFRNGHQKMNLPLKNRSLKIESRETINDEVHVIRSLGLTEYAQHKWIIPEGKYLAI